MDRYVICAHCNRRITSREDLVTALMLFSLVPYHAGCYARALRGCQTAVLGNEPVNGLGFTIGAGVSVLLSVWVFFSVGPMFALLFWIPVTLRLYSYYTIESRLD